MLTVLIALAVVAAVWQITKIRLPAIMSECLFLRITGLYCPGCGGTRAIRALFTGHILKSFIYHPLVLYTAVFGGWYLISHTIEIISKEKCAIGMRYRDIYLYIALAIVALNFIVKNLFVLIGHIYLIG